MILGAVALFAGYEVYRAYSGHGQDGVFQGYVEGDFVLVGAEVNGRIDRLGLTEGSGVKKGDLLFAIDERLARARLSETEAAYAEMFARLNNLKSAQQRPEKISILRAVRKRRKADLDLSIVELRRQEDLHRRHVTSREQFDRARAEFLKARAALDEIDRQISFARLPARPGLVAAAEAGLAKARAARDQARIQVQKQRVHAPVAGIVQQIFFREGEIIAAGQPVISLLPPDRLKVLFFVPETRRSSLTNGLRLKVRCDGCPDMLSGRISFISREAEYTPPIIFGPKTRGKLVFRVEALLEPAARFLSPGQPVTVDLPATGAEAR